MIEEGIVGSREADPWAIKMQNTLLGCTTLESYQKTKELFLPNGRWDWLQPSMILCLQDQCDNKKDVHWPTASHRMTPDCIVGNVFFYARRPNGYIKPSCCDDAVASRHQSFFFLMMHYSLLEQTVLMLTKGEGSGCRPLEQWCSTLGWKHVTSVQ